MYFVKASDDVSIAVYDYNPKGKKTVFLVHGWPLSHLMYEYQLEMLLACGYRVVSVDLRGFGNSDVPAYGYSYDQMADDIYRVICALRLNRFVLVGFSMGGAVVLRYMRKYQCYGGGTPDTACGGSALLDAEGRISIWAHKGIRERIDKAGLYGSAQAGLGIQP